MKAVNFSKILGQSKALRTVCLACAAPALVMTFSVAQAGTSAPATAPVDPTAASNWIGFTVGGAFVSGDRSGMMRRTQTNGDFYGGIDSFQFSQALDKTTTLTFDGHALPGLEDYEANLNVTKADVGYIKAGYKQYRTWYDGSGGYMPQLSQQYREPAWGEDLSVDRGQFEFEAGLRMENLPEITFNYKHAFRNGDKDSTAWGERPQQLGNVKTNNKAPLLNYPAGTPTSTTPYKFAPSFWQLDEKSDIFGLDVEHTLGNTDLGLGLNYEHTSYDNTLNTRTGSTSPDSKDPTKKNTQVQTAKTDRYTMDLFAGNIHSTTRFNDKLWLTGGFAYTTVNTNTDGWQRFTQPVGASTASNTQLSIPMGGAESDRYVGNISLMWNPIQDFTITPSVRIEQSSQDAIAQMDTQTISYPGSSYAVKPAQGTALATQIYASDMHTNTEAAALDLRYTGISDVVLYAKGEWGNETQSNKYSNVFSSATSTTATPPVTYTSFQANANQGMFREGISTDSQDYTLGANWYPVRCLSFALQGLYSERSEELDPSANGIMRTPGLAIRPAMMDHDTTTDDVNLRMTWHALSNLSLVTRYDYRETEFDNRGVVWDPSTNTTLTPIAANILSEVQSGIVQSNILSQSVTWSPLDRLYLQASASYTWSQSKQSTIWVPDSENDYFTGSLTCGYAIDDRTDLTASYTYYDAKNYAQQHSPYTVDTTGGNPIDYAMGYGLNTQEQMLSLTLNRMINANVSWNLRYAVMTSQTTGGATQDQSGGFNDFTAQMVSTGLQVRF